MLCKVLVRLSLNVHVFVDDHLEGYGASGGMNTKGIYPMIRLDFVTVRQVVLVLVHNEDL